MDTILDGPRGRSMLLSFVHDAAIDAGERHPFLSALFYAEAAEERGREGVVHFGEQDWTPPTRAELARLVAEVPLPAPTPALLLHALQASVGAAMYWQEPIGSDVVAGYSELRPALERIADWISASPVVRAWAAPMARQQYLVRFDADPAPHDQPAADLRRRWRDETVAREARMEREAPADPRANWSGHWWSTPPNGLPVTSPDLGDGLGPSGLWLMEDELGWDTATVTRAVVPDWTRVFEVSGPDDWAELCRMAPLDVSATVRHDWYRTTGRAGRWVIPDWTEIARHHDAIHLSTAGYLAAATRAIPVDAHTASMIAGWAPGETRWLTDLDTTGEAHLWRLVDDVWVPTG